LGSAAHWAAWQHGTYQVGRLVRRSGGPPSNVEKGSGTEEGDYRPLAREGGLYVDKLFAVPILRHC